MAVDVTNISDEPSVNSRRGPSSLRSHVRPPDRLPTRRGPRRTGETRIGFRDVHGSFRPRGDRTRPPTLRPSQSPEVSQIGPRWTVDPRPGWFHFGTEGGPSPGTAPRSESRKETGRNSGGSFLEPYFLGPLGSPSTDGIHPCSPGGPVPTRHRPQKGHRSTRGSQTGSGRPIPPVSLMYSYELWVTLRVKYDCCLVRDHILGRLNPRIKIKFLSNK